MDVPFAPYYQDESCTIYNADCRQVLPFLPKFDLLLTDPPYGMGDILIAGKSSRWGKHFGEKAHCWDSQTPAKSVIFQMREIADLAIIWGGQFYDLPAGRCWLTWNKIIRNWSSSEHELAWTNLQKPNRAFDYSHAQLAHEGKHWHPTQKPLPLMRWCLTLVPDAQTILDPFMGSGTTLVAAKLEGRTAVGIELEERYCESAAKRLAQGVLF
jgi:site-specific DNA-methyltransferase (adenine-specific)